MDDYIENDNYDNYRPEVGVYDRIGLPDIEDILQGINMTGDFENVKKNINRNVHNNVHRFAIYINAISRNISSDGILSITQRDIVNMIEHLQYLTGIEYKNPSCYILGYIVSKGGKVIDKELFKKVVKLVLPSLEDKYIEPEDVLRYARLWLLFK